MIHNTQIKGFTLVETLVAIAIIMVAITGPFVVTENSINATTVAHDKSIATFLAQEGIEYIHAIRDKVYISECLSGSGTNCDNDKWWSIFTTNSSGFGSNVLKCDTTSCSLDITESKYTSTSLASSALTTCKSKSSCGKLYLTPSYAYTTSSSAVNTPTIFSRKITVTKINNNLIKISVTIVWREQSSNYSITTTDTLTSWE